MHSKLLSTLRARVLDIYRMTRFSAFGATAVLPLLGAGSVERRLDARRSLGLLGVAAAFHTFAYVHNDVSDLAIDRTQPLRADYPLVRGAISPQTALGIALACIPLAFGIDALLVSRPLPLTPLPPCPPRPHGERGVWSFGVGRRKLFLAGAFGLIAAYNRWGKRCPFPPLTDAVQGLGWAMLIGYGASATGRQPNQLTMLLAAYEYLLILLVNGVHGPMRDLANDQASGARTTAILFGARVGPNGELQIPPGLLAYALALQAALLGLPIWAASYNLADLQRLPGSVAAVSVSVCSGLTLALLTAAANGQARPTDVGMLHLILLLSMPIILLAPGLNRSLQSTLLAAHLLPLLANGMTYDALRWVFGLRG